MKHILKKMTFCFTALLASLSCQAIAQPATSAEADLIARGHYLAIAGDCSACHNNPTDSNPYSGGFGVQSPLGLIYGANITPSKVNGIGNYSLEDFSRAVRFGVAPGGKNLFPAMPYTAFAGMSDDDIAALYAYFMKGVEPVDHQVQQTNLGFPFIRPAMIGWNLLFLNKKPVDGSDAVGSSVSHGEYLVKTLGHCSTCHTPRNAFAAEKMSQFLSGGKAGAWTAPNITPDKETGIGDWSEQDIFTYLKTGRLEGKAYANGDMGLAVQNSFSKLEDHDLQAIAAYLKQLPAIKVPAQQRSGKKSDGALIINTVETGQQNDFDTNFDLKELTGAQIYNGACATCHGANGQGALSGSSAFPPLRGTTTVDAKDPSNLIMTIYNGVDRKTNGLHVFMPAFQSQFNQDELVKVADYVSSNFSYDGHKVTKNNVEVALSGGPKPGFLLENAKTLSIVALVVLIMLVTGLLCRVMRRKKAKS